MHTIAGRKGSDATHPNNKIIKLLLREGLLPLARIQQIPVLPDVLESRKLGLAALILSNLGVLLGVFANAVDVHAGEEA